MTIKAGDKLPQVPASLTVEAPDKTATIPNTGKIIIVGVPGAFTRKCAYSTDCFCPGNHFYCSAYNWRANNSIAPCSDHVPTYIHEYANFEKKGYKDIYIVGVNDQFVLNAWKKHLTSQLRDKLKDIGIDIDAQMNHIHFLADRSAEYVKSLGLSFDASGLLGGERSQRFAIVAEDGVAKDVRVEDNAPDLKVSVADQVLASLDKWGGDKENRKKREYIDVLVIWRK